MRSGLLLAAGSFCFAALAASCSDELSVGQLRGQIASEELIDFGDVQIGILLPYELEVENAGSTVIAVQDIEVAPNFTAEAYEFKLSETSYSLPPGGSRRMVVSFRPFAAMEEPVESTFTFKTDAVDENGAPHTFTVRVRGRGIETGLIVEPMPVDFGTVLVGSTKTLDIKITNALGVPVDVLSHLNERGEPQVDNQGGLGRFQILSPVQANGSLLQAGQILEPNASVTVQAMYVPDPATQEGLEDRGRWTISNCPDALCELPVPMIGKGTNAALVCTPASVDFGDRNPGSTSTLQATCENAASETVTITGWRLDPGSAPEYSVAAYNGNPSSLPPGSTFTVDLQFSPTLSSVGRDILGTLVITGRNPRANRDLNPTRLSIVGRAGGPDIDVTPPQLNFGRVGIGTTSRRRVLVSNVGYSDLAVTMITGDADGTGVFATARNAMVVPAGGSEVIELTFSPTTEGLIESRLIINSDDTDEPEVVVPLQGTGADLPPCSYSVTPMIINFGIVPVLRSTTQGLRIQNTGTNDCLINDLEIAPGSSPAFTLVNGPETGVTLAPGAEKTIIIEFVPPGEGLMQGLLTFYISNPADSTPEVQLRGTGSASALLITPNELNFGKIGLDCSTRERIVTVYNTGSQPTVLQRIEIPTGISTEFEIVTVPAGIPSPPGAGASVNPGQSVEFTVRYHARDVGVDTGFLHIIEAGRTDPYVIPLYGEGAVDATNEDRFTQLETPEVDILFVIDNSCSMSEEQASLTQNFASFIQFADAQALDYRIAVITTDIEGDLFGGAECPRPLVAMRPAGEPQGACGYFADGNETTRNADWRLVTPEEQPSPEAAFTAIGTQGIDGSGTEQGLQAAYQALSAPLITGWNAGFLRPDAYLALIFVSDEEDQSLQTTAFYSNFFKAIKGFRNSNLFSASAIVGNAQSGCATADAGDRYISVATQTGGIFESICTPSWSASLENLGLSVFGYKSRFFLSNQPVPGTLEVFVDGVRVDPRAGSGQVRWSYDPGTNSINFAPLAIPEPGSEIVVRYQAECL